MKIAMMMFPKLTPLDVVGPLSAWNFMPGVEIQTIAREPGPLRTDTPLQLVASHGFDDCFDAPDVLFVPGGGHGAFEALQDDVLLDKIAALGARAAWVTSVCNGSLLLGAAGLLKGYTACSYWYARENLRLFGATPSAARYVIDRNRATGSGVSAGIDFGLAMVGIWGGEPAGQLTELLLEYAPQAPYGVGSQDLAPPELLAIAKPILAKEMPVDLARAAAERRGFLAD